MKMSKSPSRVAVILAGAGTKGAYEAGALHVLAREDIQIVRVVAASSGALNGVLLAAAVRANDLEIGTDKLIDLWKAQGWADVFHPKLGLLCTLRGISDNAKMMETLREHVPPQPIGEEINLRLLVAPLGGVTASIGNRPATSYEGLCDFSGSDFATTTTLEKMFAAATASAAFPLVFGAVDVDGLGPCVDGGAVNNTPIARALDGTIGDSVDRIIVISTAVEQRTGPLPKMRGLTLASHLGDMLIDERLFRDLREAEATNASLRQLDALVAGGVITAPQLQQVLVALGWTSRRVVDVIQIRPLEELPGSVFTGLFEPELRDQYVEAGKQRARDVLASLR